MDNYSEIISSLPSFQSRVYRPLLILWLLLPFSLMVAGAEGYMAYLSFIGLLHPVASPIVLALLTAVTIMAIFGFLAYLCTAHLEVSTEGLTLSGIGFRFYTPWHMLVQMSWVRNPSSRSWQPALLLREPALLNVSMGEGKRRAVAVVQYDWIRSFSRFRSERYRKVLFLSEELVPLQDWGQGDLGRFLRRYALQVSLEAINKRP